MWIAQASKKSPRRLSKSSFRPNGFSMLRLKEDMTFDVQYLFYYLICFKDKRLVQHEPMQHAALQYE